MFALQATPLSWIELTGMVVFATAHGYVAAWLAVRMLFRPRYPVKVFGVTIFPQGMIPRHRARLAQTIGRAVGNELVSQETITDALFGTDFFRRKVDSMVTNYTDDLLNTDYPSLIEALPVAVRAPVLDAIASLQTSLAEYIGEVLRGGEMRASIEKFVSRRVDEVSAWRLKDTLTPDVFEQIVKALEEGLNSVTSAPDFEHRVYEFVEARIAELSHSTRTLADVITPEAVALIRERIEREVPPVVHHLAEIATSPRTRNSISALIKREVDDYYSQLSFFKKVFVSRERIDNEVDDLVNTTLPRRIEEYLHGEAFETQAREFLGNLIDNLLHRPLDELVGKIEPETLAMLKNRIAEQVLTLARSDDLRDAVATYAREALARVQPHSLGAILEFIKPASEDKAKHIVTRFITDVVGRPDTANALNKILNAQVERLLMQPIGRPVDYIGRDKLARTSSALTERITLAAQERLPIAIKEFDIGGIVEQKVGSYPVEKLETLVLSIAGTHLRTIEMFGLVIGFLLGIAQVAYFIARPYFEKLF